MTRFLTAWTFNFSKNESCFNCFQYEKGSSVRMADSCDGLMRSTWDCADLI